MKYIKTKEYGICKVIDEDKHTLSYENSYVVGVLWKDDYKDKIQYADTIEELCDEFVVYEEDQLKPINMPLTEKTQFEKMKEIIKLGLKTKMNCWLKLAIWTDKGLIYVAKMNDKGELELL